MRIRHKLQCLTLGAGLAVGLALVAAPSTARADHDDTRAFLRLVAAGIEFAAYADDRDRHPRARSHGHRWQRREARLEAERRRLVRKARRALDRGRYHRASRLLRRIAEVDRERGLIAAQYRRHGRHGRAACAPPAHHGRERAHHGREHAHHGRERAHHGRARAHHGREHAHQRGEHAQHRRARADHRRERRHRQ